MSQSSVFLWMEQGAPGLHRFLSAQRLFGLSVPSSGPPGDSLRISHRVLRLWALIFSAARSLPGPDVTPGLHLSSPHTNCDRTTTTTTLYTFIYIWLLQGLQSGLILWCSPGGLLAEATGPPSEHRTQHTHGVRSAELTPRGTMRCRRAFECVWAVRRDLWSAWRFSPIRARSDWGRRGWWWS